MGVMTLAMMKKAQHKPMMDMKPTKPKKMMKGKMRNRKIHGKGSDE